MSMDYCISYLMDHGFQLEEATKAAQLAKGQRQLALQYALQIQQESQVIKPQPPRPQQPQPAAIPNQFAREGEAAAEFERQIEMAKNMSLEQTTGAGQDFYQNFEPLNPEERQR